MKSPTIQDVADEAGVAKSSVSRYLNNHPNISDSLRARIEAAITSTGYNSDPLISNFLSGVRRQSIDSIRGVIGWINTHSEEDHWRNEQTSLPLYEGVRDRARESRMGFEEFWTKQPGMTPIRLHRILTTRNIKALIIPPNSDVLNALPGFDWSSYAVVTVNPSSRENYNWHSVGTDGAKDAILLFSKLRIAGYKQIGLVLERGFSARDGHGMLGRLMIEPLIEKTPEPIKPFVYKTNFTKQSTLKAFKEWLNQGPDAIICHDVNIMHFLQSEGYRIPEDIGMVNIACTDAIPYWSGLRRNTRDKGRAAVNLLTMQLSQNLYGIPQEPFQILISDNWVEGNTTRIK